MKVYSARASKKFKNEVLVSKAGGKFFNFYQVTVKSGSTTKSQVVRFNFFERFLNKIYSFFSKKKNPFFQSKVKKHFKGSTATLSDQPKTKNMAKNIFKSPRIDSKEAKFAGVCRKALNEKVQEKILKTMTEIFNAPVWEDFACEGVTLHETQDNCVLIFDEIPEVVIKLSREGILHQLHGRQRSEVRAFKEKLSLGLENELFEKARDLCKENQLDKIKIPRTLKGKIGGVDCEFQERVDLPASHAYQKGFVRQLQREAEKEGDAEKKADLTDYFKQLTTFAIKFGFTDLKPNNIGRNSEGRAVLFDLDQHKPSMQGLYRSGAITSGGLLNSITLDTFDEIVEHARKVAKEEIDAGRMAQDELDTFEEKLQTVRAKKPKRIQKTKEYEAYLEKNQIEAKTPIPKEELETLFPNDIERECAVKMIDLLNNRLKTSSEESYEIRRGRKFYLHYNDKDFQEVQKFLRKNGMKMQATLQKLRDQGLIFYVKEKQSYRGFQVNL